MEETYCIYTEENESHDWFFIGVAPDGTEFYKCHCCGIVSEI